MSTLIIEVCKIDSIDPHPNADRLEIATIKGWKICCQKGVFTEGQKVVYFPPDAVLPPQMANGPEDDPPGRLNCMKYLKALPKNEDGVRPDGGRVCATRLRGFPSFGLVMPLNSDEDWEVGTDVAKHFGITKYEPPEKTCDGDVAAENVKFYKYSSPEHYANYPYWLREDEEVTITEKIHGKNNRLGLTLDNDNSNPVWQFQAGSHDVNRKEHTPIPNRFKLQDLKDKGVLKDVEVGQIFKEFDRWWKVDEIRERESGIYLATHEVYKNGDPVLRISEYWLPMTENVKNFLKYLLDTFAWHEPKYSIILYGEIYGSGVQDMTYGMENGQKSFAAFDISINGQYLGWHTMVELCHKFDIATVKPLYVGPWKPSLINEYTSGNTTMCDKSKAGKFKGREGIVIKPTINRIDPKDLKRVIVKSVSADYLSRKGGTEFH